MKYIVRINPKAFNPLTKKVIVDRLWEVEQCSNRDSARVLWHCRDVRIDAKPIQELFMLPKAGEPPWQWEGFGVCVRGYDDAIEIHTGPHDSSGNT